MSLSPFPGCESRISLTSEPRRKILRDVRSSSAITKCGQVAALIGLASALAPQSADACKVRMPPAADIGPPVVLDAGFEPPANDGHDYLPARLWIRLQPPRGRAPHYVLEPVAGHAPLGIP